MMPAAELLVVAGVKALKPNSAMPVAAANWLWFAATGDPATLVTRTMSFSPREAVALEPIGIQKLEPSCETRLLSEKTNKLGALVAVVFGSASGCSTPGLVAEVHIQPWLPATNRKSFVKCMAPSKKASTLVMVGGVMSTAAVRPSVRKAKALGGLTAGVTLSRKFTQPHWPSRETAM